MFHGRVTLSFRPPLEEDFYAICNGRLFSDGHSKSHFRIEFTNKGTYHSCYGQQPNIARYYTSEQIYYINRHIDTFECFILEMRRRNEGRTIYTNDARDTVIVSYNKKSIPSYVVYNLHTHEIITHVFDDVHRASKPFVVPFDQFFGYRDRTTNKHHNDKYELYNGPDILDGFWRVVRYNDKYISSNELRKRLAVPMKIHTKLFDVNIIAND